jgi:hypothetical protein
LAEVREAARQKQDQAIQPLLFWLNCLARRLAVEADMSYRAYTNVLNPHAYKRPTAAGRHHAGD